MNRFGTVVVVADYYLAAILVLIAGVMKIDAPGVSELLTTLLDLEIFNLDTVIFISRTQPFFEIILGLWAFSGWQARICAPVLGVLYLVFCVLILIASQGFLMLPIDCGCFGPSEGSPALYLIGRNILIALPLFFYRPKHLPFTLIAMLKKIQPRSC